MREQRTDFIKRDARQNLAAQRRAERTDTPCGFEDFACCGGLCDFRGLQSRFEESPTQHLWSLAELTSSLFQPFVDLWWEVNDKGAHSLGVPQVRVALN